MSKAVPKVIQMTMRCSRSPLWWNAVGLCEVQSRAVRFGGKYQIAIFLTDIAIAI